MNPLRQNSQPSQQTFDNAMQLLRPLSSPPFPCQARRQHQKYSILHRAVCSRPAKPMNVQTGPVKGPMCSPVLEPRTSNTTLPHLRQCNTPQPAHPQMWLLPRINSPQPFKSLANAHAAIPPTSRRQIRTPRNSLHAAVLSTLLANASMGPENSLSNYIACSCTKKPMPHQSPHAMHAPYHLIHVFPQLLPSKFCTC